MKKTDKTTSCAFGNNKFASVRHLVNTLSNLSGIMFIVTFLGYIVLHCF
ncbi:MAG: hypothetical protein IKW83_00965 [Muribaculaceae bacterium]|nr:hypothetical protein [Muribaculaceae bacterium]